MKPTLLLKEQHDEVRDIFRQLQTANGHSKALLEKLETGLAGHMVIEQDLFYPAVLTVKEDLVLECYEEHAVARFALKRLLETAASDRTFKAKLTTLKELLEGHMKEEETELFPAADKALGARSDALYAKMKELFEKTTKEAAGYERAVGPGGAALTSAKSPSAAHE